MPEGNKPILGYWNIRGVTHPIRFLLAYLGIDYDEKLYRAFPPFEEGKGFGSDWFENDKYKLGLDFPNLPYWIEGDIKLTESKVILKYLAEEKDPSKALVTFDTPMDNLRAQIIANLANEITRDLCFTCWQDPEEIRLANVKRYQAKIKEISVFLGEKPWIMGEKISYPDFFVYEAIHINGQYEPNLLVSHQNLKRYKERFEGLPKIKAYMESSGFIKSPCNSAAAKRPIF